MKRFSYTAVDSQKRKTRGQFIAADEDQLRKMLSDQDLFLVKAKELKSTTPNTFFTLSGSVGIKDIAVFCSQFASMFSSGIDVVETLETLVNQPYPQLFRLTLQEVLLDVNSGLLLSEAMGKHKKIFPEFFISMISIGEHSGKLDDIFKNMADYYDNQIKVKAKFVGAITYPIVLLCLTFGVVFIISFLVIPKFQEVFSDLGQELPPITQVVFDFAEWVKRDWKVILLVILGTVILIIGGRKTKKGKFIIDKFGATFPLSSHVIQASFAARFARCFSILLDSGMQVVTAMEILCPLLGNSYYMYHFEKAIVDVRNGIPISKAFQRTKIFPPMLLQMVMVGERTGTLAETLQRTSSIFDHEQNQSIDKMTAALNPILLIFIAVFVVVVLLAIFLPLMNMTSGLGA